MSVLFVDLIKRIVIVEDRQILPFFPLTHRSARVALNLRLLTYVALELHPISAMRRNWERHDMSIVNPIDNHGSELVGCRPLVVHISD